MLFCVIFHPNVLNNEIKNIYLEKLLIFFLYNNQNMYFYFIEESILMKVYLLIDYYLGIHSKTAKTYRGKYIKNVIFKQFPFLETRYDGLFVVKVMFWLRYWNDIFVYTFRWPQTAFNELAGDDDSGVEVKAPKRWHAAGLVRSYRRMWNARDIDLCYI